MGVAVIEALVKVVLDAPSVARNVDNSIKLCDVEKITGWKASEKYRFDHEPMSLLIIIHPFLTLVQTFSNYPTLWVSLGPLICSENGYLPCGSYAPGPEWYAWKTIKVGRIQSIDQTLAAERRRSEPTGDRNLTSTFQPSYIVTCTPRALLLPFAKRQTYRDLRRPVSDPCSSLADLGNILLFLQL